MMNHSNNDAGLGSVQEAILDLVSLDFADKAERFVNDVFGFCMYGVSTGMTATLERMVTRAVCEADQTVDALAQRFEPGTAVLWFGNGQWVHSRVVGRIVRVNDVPHLQLADVPHLVPAAQVHLTVTAWVKLHRRGLQAHWIKGTWNSPQDLYDEINMQRDRDKRIERVEVSFHCPPGQ